MKKKVKVNNKWKYRLFLLQFFSAIATFGLLISKLVGFDISWFWCFSPMIISIGAPILIIFVTLAIFLIVFGGLMIFSKKDKKEKLLAEFLKIQWKR